jgi:hypothetical protein
MKFLGQASVLHGIKQSAVEMDGKRYSSTTFYLPADLAENGAGKAIGAVTTGYKCGDATEFDKWAHLSKSFPPGGLPVTCDFDVVAGKDAQGKDTGKLTLLAIRPAVGSTPSKAA